MICDGFIFNREDHTKKDLYIELIDFDEPAKNVFKIVNQFEIEGINNQLRIPDGIVFINAFQLLCLSSRAQSKKTQQSWTPILNSPCVIAEIFPNSSNIMPSSS